jgi:hypothetical protein
MGNQYVRYDLAHDQRDRGAKSIAGNWGQFDTWPNEPDAFVGGVDAALTGTGTYAGKAWFFKGNRYLRYNIARDIVEMGPEPIVGNWNWPAAWTNGIDAAIHGIGVYDGTAWFFRGAEYIRYNLERDQLEVPPTRIAGKWGGAGWPASFATGIDGASYGTGEFADKIYFFRGDQYLRYDPAPGRDVVERGPLPVADNWPNLLDEWYPNETAWGVDSVSPATTKLGNQTLFDYVTEKCGMQPSFWGRYLQRLTANGTPDGGDTGGLTAAEASFILGRGCRILPIYRGAGPVSVAGGRHTGQADAAKAIAQAERVGVPPGVVIYVDIEPNWAPVRDWFLGWWDGMAPSPYNDGIYSNGQATNPFSRPYAEAFVARDPDARATFLWAQVPQHANPAEFRGCPTAREALRSTYAPVRHPSNAANTVLWQLKINCLPFPFPGDIHLPVAVNQGRIDNNLALPQAVDGMWGA